VLLPDHDARAEMFKLHLNGRTYNESEIRFDKLSDMTDGYIASDIAYIVNDAAMVAAFTGQDITEELLEQSIHNTHPSLRKDVLKHYEMMRENMEGIERRNLTHRPIGFITYGK
jgi:transitional endoplasmic reticulum ATPase